MTKEELKDLLDRNVKAPEMKNVIETLLAFLYDIGIDYEVRGMEDQREKIRYGYRIHKRLVMDNPKVPGTLDFYEAYSKFFPAVVYGHVELKEKSIQGLILAFNKWIDTVPLNRPKQLPAPNPDEKKNLHPNLIYWSDYEIQRQISILAKIGMQGFLNTEGGKGYMSRLGAEAKKRNLEPLDIKL